MCGHVNKQENTLRCSDYRVVLFLCVALTDPPIRHHRRHTREPTRTRTAGPHSTHATRQALHILGQTRACTHSPITRQRHGHAPGPTLGRTHHHPPPPVQQQATHRLREYAGTFSPANASQQTSACASTAQHRPQHPANRPKHKGHARTQAHNARAHTTSAS